MGAGRENGRAPRGLVLWQADVAGFFVRGRMHLVTSSQNEVLAMPATDLVPIVFTVVIALVVAGSLAALAITAVLNYRRNSGGK